MHNAQRRYLEGGQPRETKRRRRREVEKTPAPRIARLRLRDRGVTLSLQVYNPMQELPPKVEFDNLGAN